MQKFALYFYEHSYIYIAFLAQRLFLDYVYYGKHDDQFYHNVLYAFSFFLS